MFKTDKIAVLMAVCNGEKYIEEQIRSLLEQSGKDWELFIHDDGSADRSAAIARAYAQREPERIHVLEGAPCGGARENFFFLLRQVEAPYVMFCDQDDVWLPGKIELTMQRMRELEARLGAQRPLLVFSDLTVADSALRPIAQRMSVYQKLDPRRTRPRELMIQNVITGCTVMVNRALAQLALRGRETERIIMHDWWCALVAACFGEISYIDRPLVLYRQHGDNSVGAKKINSMQYLQARLRNRRDIKDSLAATQAQTAYFVSTYSVTDPVLRGYARLGGLKKVQRLWFYAKNGVKKSGWQRNLGLLIWG